MQMATNNTTVSFLNTTVVDIDTTQVGIMYLVTSLLVMFSNGIVVAVVVTSSELHLPTLWNIAFMASCDFIYGLYFLMFAVPSAFMKTFAYPDSFIVPSSCIQTFLVGQNTLNIAVATVDRYLSVCWPLKYHKLMSGKRFIIAIVVIVIINVCRLCLIYVPNVDAFYHPHLAITIARLDTLLIVGASVGFPYVIILVIIGFLLKLLWEIARARRRVHPAAAETNYNQFTITICLSALVFCLSFIPPSISVAWNLKHGLGSVPMGFIKFVMFILLSNSLWNVVIYAYTYKPFRDGFLRLFCKGYYRKKRQMEVISISRNNGAEEHD